MTLIPEKLVLIGRVERFGIGLVLCLGLVAVLRGFSGSWFFDNLDMKEGKRRRRWSCDSGSLWLGVLRSYAGTLIFQQGSIGLDAFSVGID